MSNTPPQAQEFKLNHPLLGDWRGFRWNEGAPRKVLMLHGWLDNCESFHLLAPQVAKDCDVITLDLAGHGSSFHRQGPYGYNIHDYLSDLRFIIQTLGWQKVEFICHSMGAAISTVYASVYPEAVERLVLMDAYLPFYAEPQEIVTRLRDYNEKIERSWRKKPRRFAELEAAVNVRYEATPDLPLDTCRRIVTRNLHRLQDGGFEWCFDEKLKLPTALRFSRAHLMTIHEAVVCPTMIFLGKVSPYSAFHPELHKLVMGRSNFEVIEFETSGHYPHVDALDHVLQHI